MSILCQSIKNNCYASSYDFCCVSCVSCFQLHWMNICLSLKYVVRRPAFSAPLPVPYDKKDAWGRCHASSDLLSPQPVHWCRVLCTTQLPRHDQPPKWSKIMSCLEWQAGWKWSAASNITILAMFFFTFTFDNFKRVQIQKRCVLLPPDTPEKQQQNDCSGICCILLHNHCSCLCHQTAGNEVQFYSSSVAIHQHNSVAVNSGSSYGGLDQWMAVELSESLHHCLLFSFYFKWPHLLLFHCVNITRTLKAKNSPHSSLKLSIRTDVTTSYFFQGTSRPSDPWSICWPTGLFWGEKQVEKHKLFHKCRHSF